MEGASTAGNTHARDSDNASKRGSKRRRRDPRGKGKKQVAVKRRMRRVALFFGYEGWAYEELVKVFDSNDIRGRLEEAIKAAGGFTPDIGHGESKSLLLPFAELTPQGTSAAGQCFGVKIACDSKGVLDESLVRAINEHLPQDIRCFGFTRVAALFNPGNHCDSRRYEYLVPLQTLGGPNAPLGPEGEEEDKKDPAVDGSQPPKEQARPGAAQQQMEGPDEQPTAKTQSDQQRCPDPQASTCRDPRIVKLNKILAQYEGLQPSHNFADASLEDGSFQVDSMRAEEPFLVGSVYCVCVQARSPYFDKNQILGMIGLALHIFHGHCPPETLKLVLSKDAEFSPPMAPATGLLFDTPGFSAYNHKHSSPVYEPVTAERWRDEIDRFKREHLYRHIARTESANGTMAEWLKTSVPAAKYDRKSILALWDEVREDNPKSPAGMRRARMLQQYRFWVHPRQAPLLQSEVEDMNRLFEDVFPPVKESPHRPLEIKYSGTDERRLFPCRIPPRPVREFVCVPHGLFLLGPPPHHETPALGLATRPYLMLAIEPTTSMSSVPEGDRVTMVDPRLAQPVLLRPTGLRLATMTEEVSFTCHAQALSRVWRDSLVYFGIPSMWARPLNVVVRPPPDGPPPPQIADLLAMALASARAKEHSFYTVSYRQDEPRRAPQQELAFLAARTFAQRQLSDCPALEAFRACFAMSPDPCGLARYNPAAPKDPATLHPLAPFTRFFFIAHAAHAQLSQNSSPPPLSTDLQKLVALLARGSASDSALEVLIGCAQGEPGRLREELEKLGMPFAELAHGIRTKDDCGNVAAILRYWTATKTLASAEPKLLTAGDIGAAMSRVQGGEAEGAMEKEDELCRWCLDNGAEGARRVGEDEMVKKETGILCVVDDEKEPDFKQKAEKKWGSDAVRAVDVVGGAFVVANVSANSPGYRYRVTDGEDCQLAGM